MSHITSEGDAEREPRESRGYYSFGGPESGFGEREREITMLY